MTWISSIASQIMDAVSGLFLNALGTDMVTMEEYFPFITKAFDVMQYTAWAVLFLIVVWQLFRAFGGPITEAENPWQLVVRGAIFALLIGYAKPIFMLALDIARAPYTALMDVSMTAEEFTFAGVEQVLSNGLLTIVSTVTVVGPILVLILLIALGWNYFKLLLEAVERYIVVGVLCYTSPLAFCMGGSKATNQVFKSWCRMVGSQLLLLVMNVWFIRGFNSSAGQYIGNGGALSTGQGSIFLWLFCALAFLKTAQKFDSYMAAMAHRDRNLRVAETIGMHLIAGVETRAYLLPALQYRAILRITPDAPAFYLARDFKRITPAEQNKTMFTRIVGAIFYPGGCYAVYNTRNAAMKWNGMGEFKALHSLTELARMNAGVQSIDSAILLGESYDTALTTLLESDKNRRLELRFDGIYRHIYFVPMNAGGIRQLRLLTVPDWKEKLLELLFDPDVRSYKGDHFWDNGEANLLKALVLYIDLDRSRSPETKNLAAAYQLLTQNSERQLTALFEKLPLDHPARAPFNLFSQASDTVRSGIVLGLGTRLQVLQNEAVRDIISRSDIDLTAPGKRKCAYFVILSDQDATMAFLSSLFFSFLFIKLVRYADSTPELRCKVPVNLIFDEFNNVGKLGGAADGSDFARTLSVIRSRAIYVMLAVQSLGQLQNRYPNNLWAEIVGNLDVQLMLGCTDEVSAEYFSARSGDMSVEINSTMTVRKTIAVAQVIPQYRQTEGQGRRRLLTPDEVLRIPNEELLVVIRGHNVLKLKKFDYADHPLAKELTPVSILDYTPPHAAAPFLQTETTSPHAASEERPHTSSIPSKRRTLYSSAKPPSEF